MATVTRCLALLAAVPPLLATAGVVRIDTTPHMGNECDDEKDGHKCHDDGVLECLGKRTLGYTRCQSYEECHDGACREEACKNKGDGFHCHDDSVVNCLAGRTIDAKPCGAQAECKAHTVQMHAALCVDFCQQRSNGLQCQEDDYVVQCQDGQTVSAQQCDVSQKCSSRVEGGVQTAQCQEHDCQGKASGTYCMHGGVLECKDKVSVGLTACPFYQECKGHDGAKQCVEDACDDKSDGWHCKDHHRVMCRGSRTVDHEVCPDLTECHKVDGLDDPVCQNSAWSMGPSLVLWVAAALLPAF